MAMAMAMTLRENQPAIKTFIRRYIIYNTESHRFDWKPGAVPFFFFRGIVSLSGRLCEICARSNSVPTFPS